MTAATMDATSLRDRALELVRITEAELEERRIAEAREKFERVMKELLERVGALTGESTGPASVELTIENENPIATTADGLRFALRKPAVAHRSGNWDLCVAVDCSRNCGKPLWVMIGENLLSLGYVLAVDHHHDFDCLQQFDEEGEPTTDRWGKPFPPHERVSSPVAAFLPVVHAVVGPRTIRDDDTGHLSAQRNPDPHSADAPDRISLNLLVVRFGNFTTCLTPKCVVRLANELLTDEERALIRRGEAES